MRQRKRKPAGVAMLVLLLALTSGGNAWVVASAPATAENVQAWQAKMANAEQPSAQGCFTARYPRTVWLQTACGAAPSTAMKPKSPAPGPGPFEIGNKNHLVVEAPSGTISYAEGTFEDTQVLSVSSPIDETEVPVADAYTLQLNTEFFDTDECRRSTDSECRGWQQFIFANNGTSGRLYMQYWLRQHNGASCPDGWEPIQDGSNTHCKRQSDATLINSNTPIQSMEDFKLVANLKNSSLDVVEFFIGTVAKSYFVAPVFPDLRQRWAQAEFNVFGYGNGRTAVFNDGATTRVRTKIDYGGTAEPGCVDKGFTAERNNLNFDNLELEQPGAGPALVFQQSQGGLNTDADCKYGETVGDTHQLTFSGLLYDFQASGDFVEARIGSAFEVQTRKVSGAPTWPNASVNRSAAVRMGGTTVAVCEGTRLVVDGTATGVLPGESLTLPSGVRIERSGNAHHVSDLSGNSMRVEAKGSYIDLQIGLGRWPQPVRGLSGNPSGNPRLLEARDGTRFAVPVPFSDLYNRFGNSWRLSPATSLLSPCNSVVAGNPTAPFYSINLPSSLRQQAEYRCRSAGVSAAWLDACTLDVAVLGPAAAAVFVGRRPPIVNGNPPPTCNPAVGCRTNFTP